MGLADQSSILIEWYPVDDHKDFYLPTDVTVFCQPEGCITINAHSKRGQSKDPQFFVFMLTEKDSAKIRYGVCLNFYQCAEKRMLNVDPQSKRRASGRKGKDHVLTLTSLCFISHHPFISIFHDLLVLLKRIIDSCNYRAEQKTNIKDIVWSVLTGHWHDTIPPEAMREIKEIETWILMLLSSPVPVPGKTKVELEFALPDHTRFCLVDFPLHLPFELLGIDMAVRVLAAIMLEFKVVIQSRNYNAVSMCVLSLVHLLYPLEYMFPVIPLLPAYMPSAEQLLLAPTPFVIGVPASFFAHKRIKEVPNDVILVDLDSNQITVLDDLFIPNMPEPDVTILKNSLSAALNTMSMRVDDERRGSLEACYAVDTDIVDVSCRVAMVKFFNSPNIFGNFSEHTRTLRLYPRPVVALQSESFLRSRPQCSQFITDLCRTQAVEYFAECCLCPKNETFVRVQAGIDNPTQIGDKAKWFSDSLMPVHFTVYPNASSLCSAYHVYSRECADVDSESDGNESRSIDSSSSIDDLIFDGPDEGSEQDIIIKPLAEVNDVYKEPLTLELPPSDSATSLGSSISSGRSSPESSPSASALDSEADFARLAENLALKSDSKGSFSFDHADDGNSEMTPISQRRKLSNDKVHSSKSAKSTALKGMRIKGLSSLTDSGEKVLGPTFMSAINGYAERSQDIFSQVLNKTAPKAQALRERTMRPLAAAAATKMEQSQHLVKSKTTANQTSAQAASQQSKNQQTVREICDNVLSGQGVGVFTYPKLKRLMEDESLRELVCSKLNLGLEYRLTDEDYVKEIALTRAQYKGYVRVLQACIAGIEVSFNSPGCCGLASVFHVLEIAHTHYWCKGNDITSPSSSTSSTLVTPSTSLPELDDMNDGSTRAKLPSSSIDIRTPTRPVGAPMPLHNSSTQLEKSTNDVKTRVPPAPPPLPPRDTISTGLSAPPQPREIGVCAPEPHVSASTSLIGPPKFPPPERKPPPVPPRPNAISLTEISNSQPLSENTDSRKIPPNSLPLGKPEPQKVSTMVLEPMRHYIYQDLILPTQNPLWQKVVFWENAFVDVVAQERDIVGMDQEPCEMIDRYAALSESEKKRLELEEDRLLSTLLHNLTAYMIMCGTGQKAIQQARAFCKTRRLLGKAHIGLTCSKEINKLLDDLPQTVRFVQGNSIPLKPLGSRLMQKHSFMVYAGSSSQDVMMFMECRELYQCMKNAMERAAARGRVSIEDRALGGEFPVHDTEKNQGGLLQVRCDGVAIIFENSQEFIDLSNIKKCNTFGGNVFLLEEYGKFFPMLDHICMCNYFFFRLIKFAMLCYVCSALQPLVTRNQKK
ncbi:DENN domain protein [Dictyocaulus viviparus]|uniref:MAP kinase-activating death domain protein n=1 Tax=Dictyocaulus viviparus TaxID=29172 RepID=A0A0D8XVU4_DICVI|nr:DENN domain protein [Dictyocaulus viviparus]